MLLSLKVKSSLQKYLYFDSDHVVGVCLEAPLCSVI